MSLQFKVFLLILSLILATAYIYRSVRTSHHTAFGSSKSAIDL